MNWVEGSCGSCRHAAFHHVPAVSAGSIVRFVHQSMLFPGRDRLPDVVHAKDFSMRNISRNKLSLSAVLSFAAIAILGSANRASAEVIFDNTPAPLPGNIPSLGYQATQTAEFGNKITFAGTGRSLGNVQIIMSDWANQADYPGVGDATGWDHPITLNFYSPGSGNTVGSLIATKTETVHVPWHTANGFSGTAFPVNFDFTGTTLPNTVIFGVAFNTQTWGANPIGSPGPYISLNYGVSESAPTVGTDPNPDDVYWNTSTAGNYADGGAGGVGTFREDTGWAPDVPSIQVNALPVPEPTSIAMLLLASLTMLRPRRRWNAAS
jgi:hypothetical protein